MTINTAIPAILLTSAGMGAREVQTHCRLDAASDTLMRGVMRPLQLSARSYHRVLTLARTIADLAASGAIQSRYLADVLRIGLADCGCRRATERAGDNEPNSASEGSVELHRDERARDCEQSRFIAAERPWEALGERADCGERRC